jgi:cytochrome P450
LQLLKQEFIVKDLSLPSGTLVWIPFMAIHRNEATWGPDVHSFKPERWLSEGKQSESEPESGKVRGG